MQNETQLDANASKQNEKMFKVVGTESEWNAVLRDLQGLPYINVVNVINFIKGRSELIGG